MVRTEEDDATVYSSRPIQVEAPITAAFVLPSIIAVHACLLEGYHNPGYLVFFIEKTPFDSFL
jgi:hypothetical protein